MTLGDLEGTLSLKNYCALRVLQSSNNSHIVTSQNVILGEKQKRNRNPDQYCYIGGEVVVGGRGGEGAEGAEGSNLGRKGRLIINLEVFVNTYLFE